MEPKAGVHPASRWDRTSAFRGSTIVALIAAGTALAIADDAPKPSAAKGFDPAIAARFASVEEWRGVCELAESSWSNWTTNLTAYSRQAEQVTHGTFVLQRDLQRGWDPANGTMHWQGSGAVTGRKTSGLTNRTIGGSAAGEFDQWQEELEGTIRWDRWRLGVSLAERYPSLDAGTPSSLEERRVGEKARRPGANLPPVVQAINETTQNFLRAFRFQGTPEERTRQWAQFERGPGIVTLTTSFTIPDKGKPQMAGDTLVRSRVVLYPVYDDVEVEVTIPGYADWLPRGNLDQPTKPGNALAARAVLKSKKKTTKPLPEVDFFRFELLDTSREPGVCLNWPLGARDEDYDLRLADLATGAAGSEMAAAQKFFQEWGLMSAGDYDLAQLPPGELPRVSFGEVSEDRQKAELRSPPKDRAGQLFAEAAIECFDFGAKAELRVTCVLKDGREIIGLMKGDNGDQDLVRLPKRSGPDWIAEKWRQDHGATKLGANSDEEKVEGQTATGDGFTLYEEYRGWVVRGKHVTGDPKAKDFFVLNLIGADAETGIGIFEALSKLRVHRLRRGEMSEQSRLMNGNHREAPHRADQHGVWTKVFSRANLGDSGARTVMEKKNVAGRPGLVTGIGILARHDPESAFNQPFNLPARDMIMAFDRAIAHELMHSVGVEEHGPEDSARYWLDFIPPGSADNPTAQPFYRTGDGTQFTVLTESGEELATKKLASYLATKDILAQVGAREVWMRLYASTYADQPAGSPTLEQRADEYVEQFARGPFALKGIVGEEGRRHSGAEDCVMRYSFATFYEAKGRPRTLYLVTPGTERIGQQICHSPAGTGANAAGRAPQSRHGDATAGNCFAQICPNDAVPPRREP